MNTRLLTLRLLPLLILALAIGTFSYLKMSRAERSKPVAKEKVWQVDVVEARPQTLSPLLVLFGKVESRNMVRAAAPGGGLVAEVLVKPGDRVLRGQKLVGMDRRDFSAANLQAQADVADIEAQLAELTLRYQANRKAVDEEQGLLVLATKEVKRIERLKKNNLSSESALSDAREVLGRQELSLITRQLEVDRYPTARKQLKARLSRAQAGLAETELAIERSEVVAEFDAVIADVPVAVGDRVRESDVLVSLYPLESLEIRARVPSVYQAEIEQALAQGDELRAEADASPQRKQLLLTRLAGEADPSGIDAFFRLATETNSLRVGNLVRIELLRPEQDNVIPVPFRAIYGNNRVFLHREDRMHAVEVESVGQFANGAGGNSLLIRSAQIEAGDHIIVTHLPNAVDGLKVRSGDAAPKKAADGESTAMSGGQ